MPVSWKYDDYHHANRYIAYFLFELPDKTKLGDTDELTIDWNRMSYYKIDRPEITDIVYIDDMVQLTVAFAPTGSDGKGGGYLPDNGVSVDVFDMNRNETVGTYSFYPVNSSDTTVMVFAPIINDMKFVEWSSDQSSGQTAALPAGGSIAARYNPIINHFDVQLTPTLVTGEYLPDLKELDVTISDKYRIDSGVALEWIKPDVIAKPNTVYTACLSIDTNDLKATNISVPGSGSISLTGNFDFAEDVTVDVRNVWSNPLEVTSSDVRLEGDMVYLYITFAKTAKEKIRDCADIRTTVPNGSSEDDILAALPGTVIAYLSDGRPVTVPAVWNSVDDFDSSALDSQTVTAHGVLNTEEYDTDGITLEANVNILAADKLSAPSATPGSGEYKGVQIIELTADEGATIHYSVVETDKGGAYPSREGLIYQIYTEPITLSDYSKDIYIFTYASMSGNFDSDILVYRYELTKPEVKKLDAKAPKIAENGNIECWYSTKSEKHEDPATGTEIDETVPDKYYADEDCTMLLDYNTEVVVPSYIRSIYTTTADQDSNLPYIGFDDGATYRGLQAIGVQEISNSDSVRALAVMDSRIINSATDFGWLFEIESGSDYNYELTAQNAPFKYSCVQTHNNMDRDYGYSMHGVPESTPYKYVTAAVRLGETPVRARFYVKLENGTDYVYANEINCLETTIESSPEMDMIVDNFSFDATKRSLFTGHSLSLGGNIGVNFYIDVLDNTVNDGKVKVDFAWTVEGNQKTHSVTLSADDKRSFGYKASCPVAAAEMTYDVTATVTIDGVVQEETNTYSAKRYADVILTDESFKTQFVAEKGEEKFNQLVLLVKTMLDYGAKAQTQFKRDTEVELANKDLVTDDPQSPYYYNPSDVNPSEIVTGASDMTAGVDAYGLEYVGSTIVYLSETSIRHYYEIKDPTLFAQYSDNIFFNGEKVDYTVKGDEIYFELKNISASNLDTLYTLKIGENEYKYSVLDYVKACLLSDKISDNMKALAAATYLYSQAANAYFEK